MNQRQPSSAGIKIMVCLIMLTALSCGGEPGTSGRWNPETFTITLTAADCTPVLIDGLFSPGEWEDALAVKTGPHSTMLFKQDTDYLYVGVDSRGQVGPATNLFLAADAAEILQFHVSAQIGERTVTSESTRSENPPWKWGYSDNWMANEVRWNDPELQRLMKDSGEWRADLFEQVVYPSHGAEFQFRKSRFGAQRYFFRLDLIYPPDYDANPEVFPEGTKMGDITGWATLELSRR